MKKILLAGACVLAFSAAAMAQSSTATENQKSDTMKQDSMKNGMKANGSATSGSAATTGSSTDSKRGVPGNPDAGGDESMSNPKSTTPGAAKAGGG